jgi:deoxyhypusine synthase
MLALKRRHFEGDPEECWLLAAAKANLPIVVPGHEDSTFGNIFASYVKTGECNRPHREVGHRVHGRVLRPVQGHVRGAGVGFFQIGGGIAGDFPICVVPSIKYDLQSR